MYSQHNGIRSNSFIFLKFATALYRQMKLNEGDYMDAPASLQASSGLPYPFGATEKKKGVNFALYVKEAEKVSICFFQEDQGETPFHEIELDPAHHKTGEVWHALIEGLSLPIVYGYRIKLRNQDDTLLLLDPYAKAIYGSPKWGEPADRTVPYRPLGKVIQGDSFDWQKDRPLHLPMKDLIIYEMHVRGFTQHPSSGVEYPGTYRGLIEKIPHLLDLGVNAIELMPIYEFNEREVSQLNPHTHEPLFNYFGYSTLNFFSPMTRYASQSNGDQAINEFKMMVRELHKNGIEIILDVVYNHTCEGNEQGPTLCYRGLDPKTYYMINAEGHYLNFSGCGNTLNCNHPITIELILNSLRYWVTEMHIDGFRFDLASILNRAENGTPLENAPIVEAISQDPILANTKLIAEAWDAGGLYQVGAFTAGSPRWSEWNGKYRDIVRCFIKGTSGFKSAFATALCGSQDLYGMGRAPYCSINFITAHDGFSLGDLVTYNDKHNFVNGENNRDGFDHNDSWNCGFEGHSSNKKIVFMRERQIRNFHLALILAQGVPMLLMGDEYVHTKDGNNNTWCQDNAFNWFLWDHLDYRPGFYRYYSSLIKFRKKHPLLGKDSFLSPDDVTWHGLHPHQPDWGNDNKFLAFTLNILGQGPDLYAAFNAAHIPHTVHLPPAANGKSWCWVVNTHNPPPEDFFEGAPPSKLESHTIRIPSYSAILLQAR